MSPLVTSPLKYFGGKYRAVSTLIQFFPQVDSKTVYIEPFCGSCVVFFNYNPDMALLNDINGDIANFWYVLSGVEPELYQRFLDIFSTTIYSVEFYELLHKKFLETKDRSIQAILTYLENRMSFSGIKDTGIQSTPARNSMHLPEDVEFYHHFFAGSKDVRVWNVDFREVFRRVDKLSDKHLKRFYYCDPPYVQQGKGYTNSFTEQDHRDLADLLRKTKVPWVLSYDENPLVRDLYSGYRIEPVSWFYSAAGHNEVQKHELIITSETDDMREM